MLMCLLLQFCLFLFLSFANAKSGEELLAIKDSLQEGNGTLSPNNNSLNMEDLKASSESTLQPLQEASSRGKRQVGNFNSQLMFDENYDDESDLSDEKVDDDIRSTLNTAELPFSKGHSAFSIHANTVYILYPSAFQDPNIFGRFAINQNMDPQKETKTSFETEKTDPEHEPTPQDLMKVPLFNSIRYPPPPSPFNPFGRFNRQPTYGRRSAPIGNSFSQQQQYFDEGPLKPDEEQNNKKRNVETHLAGTIVVLNQDVNENNVKDSY